MIIPTIPKTKLVELEGKRAGHLSDVWFEFFTQLITILRNNIGTEGFVVPQVSSASNSVSPPTSGGQIAQLAATFGNQGGSVLGTLIFDPNEANGTTPPTAPNGQLKVLLNDGTFHKVTNS